MAITNYLISQYRAIAVSNIHKHYTSDCVMIEQPISAKVVSSELNGVITTIFISLAPIRLRVTINDKWNFN